MPDFIRNPKELHLEQLKLQVEAEGHAPGSPKFEAVLRQRQVEMCQQYQQVPSCSVCPAFDGCELIKQHLRDVRFGVENR